MKPAPLPESNRHRWLTALVVTYAVLIVALLAFMSWAGDRYWLATLVLYGPRWLCAIPLPVLAILAAVWQRRLLWLLAITLAVVVGPIMGLQAHWPARSVNGPAVRLLTCNVNQNDFQPAALLALIAKEQPDVVALQEVSSATRYTWPPGWHTLNRDEFTLASRWPVVERGFVLVDVPRSIYQVGAVRYAVQAPGREIQLFNLHLESPREGLEAVLNRQTGRSAEAVAQLADVSARRAAESEKVSRWIAEFSGAKIIVGDFNMPVDSTIYRRWWSQWSNAFSSAGRGFGFTKISQKRGWSYGARIDHVLFTSPWRCMGCWIGDDVGSDHLPLIAELEWRP